MWLLPLGPTLPSAWIRGAEQLADIMKADVSVTGAGSALEEGAGAGEAGSLAIRGRGCCKNLDTFQSPACDSTDKS